MLTPAATYSVDENWTLDLVMELFERIRAVKVGAARFKWLYYDNPAGPARVWVLRAGDEPVGYAACVPREVWVHGSMSRALIASDCTVDARHRTLGPAIKLRRAAKELIDNGRYDFLFSHAAPAMLPVHLRVGHPQLGQMSRFVLLLQPEKVYARRMPLPEAARPAAARANVGVVGWLKSRLAGGGISVHQTSAPASDYDKLDRRLRKWHPVVGRRDASYLAWRFFARTDRQRVLLEARCRSKLVGFAIVEPEAPKAQVRDLVALPERGVELVLLAHAADLARSCGAITLGCMVLGNSRAEAALFGSGLFNRNKSQAAVCYGGNSFKAKSLVEHTANWYMTGGDRDI